MSFKLVGEVSIDARKGTTALRAIQGEATKTSRSFDRAGASTKNLAKSLLQLGASGGSASRSFMQLARLGVGGVFGAAAVGGINKFGEAVKNSANDYYETQKSLAGAFETSFKSRNEDEAQKGLEATEEIIDRLRGKITQMGSFGKILGGLEKLTGVNLGFGDTEKELKDARDNLKIQEELVKTRQFEKAVAKEAETKGGDEAKRVASSKILAELEFVRNGERVDLVKNAKEELKLAEYLLYLNGYQIQELYKKKNLGVDIKKLDDLARDGQIKDLGVAKARLSLEKAIKKEKEESFKQGKEVAGGILGATPMGRQAMDTATKRRQRELEKENARTADQLTGTEVEGGSLGPMRVGQQRAREKLAAQQAAANAPSLAEQIQGQRTGVNPAELAATNAAQRFEDQRKSFGMGTNPNMTGALAPAPKEEAFSALLKAIEELTKKLPAAVAQ